MPDAPENAQDTYCKQHNTLHRQFQLATPNSTTQPTKEPHHTRRTSRNTTLEKLGHIWCCSTPTDFSHFKPTKHTGSVDPFPPKPP